MSVIWFNDYDRALYKVHIGRSNILNEALLLPKLLKITVKMKLLAVLMMDTWIVVLEICNALLKVWSIKILEITMRHPNPT